MANAAAEIRINAPAGFGAEELGRGRVAVSVPRGDEATVTWLKNRNAKWDRERRAWALPGTKRAELAERFDAMNAKAAAVKAEAETALQDRSDALASIRGLKISGASVTMSFPYNAAAVAAVKALPGARWNNDRKIWTLTPTSAADVAAIESGCQRIVQMIASEAEREEADRKAAEQARADERAALATRRFLRKVGQVQVGQTLRLRDRVVTVTEIGKSWLLRSEDACIYGMMPEDCRVAYAYHRPATADEIAALEASEDSERARSETVAALADIERRMDDDGHYLPAEEIDHEAIETGEVLLETDRHLRAYGGGTRWVLAGETLWRLDGNGGDGDNWSRSNYGREIARCMTADGDMVEALRNCGRTQ